MRVHLINITVCKEAQVNRRDELCRACGVIVDDSEEKKSRHSLSDGNICSTLADFAASAVETLPSRHGGCKSCLNVKKLKLDTFAEDVFESYLS